MDKTNVKKVDKTKKICEILAEKFDFYAIAFFDNFGRLPQNFNELETAARSFNPHDKKNGR
jgi:hypothetical protein